MTVQAPDTPMTSGECFAGYGGLALAVEMAFGAETRWVAEWDDAPSKILAHRFPGCMNYRDVTTVNWYGVETVDILSGGSPCQSVSMAGRRAGMVEGATSNLWVAMREAIRITRPRFVVWENVRGAYSARAASASDPEHPHAEELDELTGRIADLEDALNLDDGEVGDDGDEQWVELVEARERLAELEKHQTPLQLRALGRVLGDLASLGYRAEWRGLKASDVGAPHARFRVFVLAELVEDHGEPHSTWPLASWDEAADVWRSPHTDIFGDAEVYTDTFPTCGAMRSGFIYGRKPWESRIIPSDALLRTPCAEEAGGGPLHPDDAKAKGQTLRLTGQILAHEGHIQPRHALPTPRATRGGSHTETVNKLPTPRATDGTNGGPGQTSHGKPDSLAAVGALLGTPRCADGVMQDLRHQENITNPRGRLEDMVALLPTPAANVADNGGSQDPDKRRAGNHSISIQDVAEHRLLPMPVAQPSGNTPEDHLRKKPGREVVTDLAVLTENRLLSSGGCLLSDDGRLLPDDERLLPVDKNLPTPTARDWRSASRKDPDAGTRQGSEPLSHVATYSLIPTPRAQNSEHRNNIIRERPKGEPQNIENALASTLDEQPTVNWGPYLGAITRWEDITGHPAPSPTEPTGKNGRHRLSAYFCEWMMGLPPGWVTAMIGQGITRNEALKALGNGVVPRQAAAALVDMRAALGYGVAA